MELTERINHLDDEISLLKAEVKAILIDVRDELLKRGSPFAPATHNTQSLLNAEPVPGAPATVVMGSAQAGPDAMSVPPAPTNDSAPPPPHLAEPVAPPKREGTRDRGGEVQPYPAHPGEDGETTVDRKNWGALDIASLCKWADGSARRIGRQRLKDILDVYELLSGPFPGGTKEAITRMVDLGGIRPEPEQVNMNDIVVVLTQLDALLGQSRSSELTVLSLLSDAA